MTTTRRILVAGAAGLLLAAAPALAGPGGSYKGKSKQNRALTFKVADGKVKAFTAGINMFCSGSGIEFNAVIPPRPMKLKRGGKFSYKGGDRSDSTNITIRGRVADGKASGIIEMTDTTYDASTRMFMPCGGSAKWSAKRR